MGDTILMQDWVTIAGATASVIVPQSEPAYIDISDAQDFVSYVEVCNVESDLELRLQTSPLKEETYFYDLVNVDLSSGQTLLLDIVRALDVVPPPARWLRWLCVGRRDGWRITFRISLNVNAVDATLGL